MLKSICTVWINDSSGVFARWRHSAMKFLNKKLMTVFSIKNNNIAEVHQFPCNSVMEFSEYLQWDRMAHWPRFLRHPVCVVMSTLQQFCILYFAGASSSCIGSMQALYGKPSVDHAFNINDEAPVSDKAKATSLPDILLVDFNSCEVSVLNCTYSVYSNVFSSLTLAKTMEICRAPIFGSRIF